MLTAQGAEPGTVGLDHFLELPIADSLKTSGTEGTAGDVGFDADKNRELLVSNPERLGFRALKLEMIIERLVELGQIYQTYQSTEGNADLLERQEVSALYAHLFGKFMQTPPFDSSTEDPTGIKVQIEALVKVLKLEGIWKDFSLVEWRIRLGALLWADNDPEEPISSDNQDTIPEKELLLYQIMMACELLLRLDVVSALSTRDVKEKLHLTPEEVRNFTMLETRKTQWDLVLARKFLDNVEIKPLPKEMKQQPAQRSLMSFFSSSPTQAESEQNSKPQIMLLPRNHKKQLDGLFHFTKAIEWPGAKEFEASFTARIDSSAQALQAPSVYSTPMSTPRPRSQQRDGYFENRPQLNRNSTQRSLQLSPSAPYQKEGSRPNTASGGGLAIGGWLTRTYLTNIILPGEPLSHFLISTLLENDPSAIEVLGDSASLYGGFVYRKRSFWSQSCIVGRVLACSPGVKSCMGWISIPHVPRGFHDGWIDVLGEPADDPNEKPRVRQLDQFAADSHLFGGIGFDVFPADLVMPLDNVKKPTSSIWFEGLSLKSNDDPSTAPSTAQNSRAPTLNGSQDEVDEEGEDSTPPTYKASLKFSSSSLSDEIGSRSFGLQYDVHFVSAFPCTPPSGNHLYVLKRKAHVGGESESDAPVAHPVHDSFTHEVHPATDLLRSNFKPPFETPAARPLPQQRPKFPKKYLSAVGEAVEDDEAEEQESESKRLSRRLSQAPSEATSQQENGKPKIAKPVLVLDARGGHTLELLCRAWCAQQGMHAIVARQGVTCIGCSVREARVADVRVIIRIG